jgi:hypothetical protein
MPALVAMRFNPDLKVKYQQLVDGGKPAKVAIAAIMRKLLVLANALLKANRPLAAKTRRLYAVGTCPAKAAAQHGPTAASIHLLTKTDTLASFLPLARFEGGRSGASADRLDAMTCH